MVKLADTISLIVIREIEIFLVLHHMRLDIASHGKNTISIREYQYDSGFENLKSKCISPIYF
jgi:hypothetical protein